MSVVDIYLRELALTVEALSRRDIEHVVDLLHDARQAGKHVFIIGNGGSAATAAHLACDLSRSARTGRHSRFRAMSLTDNVPILTATGNDIEYAEIFAEQLRNLANSGDVLIAISASGNSANILKAVECARERGMCVVGLCGNPGGKLAALADLTIIVPAARIGQQEDGHLILSHVISLALWERVVELQS